MPLFRKRPVVIEAIQWTGKNDGEIANFMRQPTMSQGEVLFIDTLEGEMQAHPRDWIIKGVKGEFYPCKPDIFEATYEQVWEQKELAQ